MAVPEQTPYIEHTGNGITTSFALKFQCESKDHLIVLVDDIEPPIATWSLTGGNVVFTTAPASGSKITLQRNTPFSRNTDYQSYNNSFRPPAVNQDFDWIWWKLQELGVADWILGNRISALKNYVDRKDDELKAYLMEEIRKQGVALDQLDEYYNYLMERLAQIAVDKGWDSSFVVHKGEVLYEILEQLNHRNDLQQDINNKNINDIRIIQESAVILESYKPAYSTEKLSNRFSTLAEAKAVYPSARALTDYVDLTVLQQAINDANGRRVITKSGRDLYLNTVGVSPDGHAGEYCLLASNAVELRPDGSTRTKLIVPSNTHGLIGMADDIIVDNMQFYGDAVATSDIGHMIKFIKCKRPKVLNSKFTNVSDAAVNFGYHYTQSAQAMDAAIANGTFDTFDIFQFGSSDFEYIGNFVDDSYGDGGLEVQASMRGKIARNDHRNCRGHGYRIVGCKDTDIHNNHGADIGTASTFSAMLSMFGGALTRNGNTAWMYNEDLRVHDNTGENVKDSIHMGIGGLNLSVFDNEIGAWNRGLYIFHTNPTCRYGLKDSRIYRNNLRSAQGKGQVYGAHLAVGVGAAKPSQGALLDNVDITDNDFDFSLKSMYTESQTVDHKITNSTIRNRYYTATSTSVGSSATGTTLDYVENTDLSGGSNNIANGTELVVTNPSGANKYGKRDELKFTRSGDTLVMQSRADLKTGQLVTLRFTSGSALPAPLTINTPYYLIVVDTKTVKLATSLTDALAGTSIPLTSDTVLHNFMTFV